MCTPASAIPNEYKNFAQELSDLDFHVSENEINRAKQIWNEETNSSVDFSQIKSVTHPILPKSNEKNILITSAMPYVNNVPHLGNVIGCTLSSDIFAKYNRMKGINTLFLCGTDDYGTPTETKALEEGLTCEEVCAKYYKEHKKVYDWFNIEFDYFGRTSTEKQTEITHDIFRKLDQKGYIYEDDVDQLYCEKCQKFLADRFVEGICPSCSFHDARGDQCDKCGKLINAIELKSPRCKVCSNSPIIKGSKHLFLDLPKLVPNLEEWIDEAMDNGHWTNTARSITNTWRKEGLEPRCITRDLVWGTPVPRPGFEEKVFYVWFDTPVGYLSIGANYSSHWEKWFKSPEKVDFYQFMAKDNVLFHSVIFPCCCLGTGDKYTLIGNLSGIEYLNYEDGKFSKSRGFGVFGNQVKLTQIDSDIFRFYLAYIRPESQDTAFTWNDFMLKNNSELVENLGHFVDQVLMICNTFLNGIVPAIELAHDDAKFLAKINQEIKEYDETLEKIKLKDGIRRVLNISRIGKQYLQAKKPWVLFNGTDGEKKQGEAVIGVCVNAVFLLSTLIYPYMPNVSASIRRRLNLPSFSVITDKPEYNSEDISPESYHYPVFYNKLYRFLSIGHKIGKLEQPLFKRIEEADMTKWREMFGGQSSSVNPDKVNIAA